MRNKAHFGRITSMGEGVQDLIGFCRREPRTVIQFAKKSWHFYLKRFVPDAVMNGHSEYARFVIIGRTRTGSNLLRGSLMSHDHILVFGDIFRNYKAIPWGIPFYPQSGRELSLMQNDPIRFLETKVFGKFPSRISAVGFKTIYPHTRNKNWEHVRTHLGDEKNFKIIHIKRENILKTHLSLAKVKQSKGAWRNMSGVVEGNGSIYLDYEDCLNAFVDTRKWEKEYDLLFKDHCKIDVLYENLSRDYKREMQRVQEFLGVNYEVTKPLTFKQSGQLLSKSISNYFELKEAFKGTPWEAFFED